MELSRNARTRSICLIEIMTMYTDEQNVLSLDEICEKLTEYGFEVTRRIVVSDIKVINTTTMKIIGVNKPKKGYFLAKCYSQEAIHLILEAVFSSDVLSEEDIKYVENYLRRNTCLPTLDLILCSTKNINSLYPRREISQESLFKLRVAIRDKKQAMLTVSRIIPEDGFSSSERLETVIVNPIYIIVYGGFLSLVLTRAITPKKAEFINLPRIKSVSIINEPSVAFSGSLKTAVNFFDGSASKVQFTTTDWLFLKFKAEDLETVENNFAAPIQFRKSEDEGYYVAKVLTAIDNNLIGWLFALSDRIEIISPAHLKNLFTDRFKRLSGN